MTHCAGLGLRGGSDGLLGGGERLLSGGVGLLCSSGDGLRSRPPDGVLAGVELLGVEVDPFLSSSRGEAGSEWTLSDRSSTVKGW